MNKLNRRRFIGSMSVAIFATPSLFLTSRSTIAAESSPVDPNDPQAKALSYVHLSAIAEANCANCRLYTGSADAEWGPRAIFPGNQVASAGWCSAWAKQAG